MAENEILVVAIWTGLALLSLAFLATVYRVFVGPTLGDRVVALDMLVGIAIGFIAIIAIKTGFMLYIDIAIALGLIGFLATIAFARFILSRKTADEEGPVDPGITSAGPARRAKASGKGRRGRGK
ncbi:cation:proton antiporter [Rhizobium helianthi]|uniref:Cation:proton antiporter n=1 Tax=Rhizobium helianthi TaxID=1132695 RepID=A0ABW4M583_9HYPH